MHESKTRSARGLSASTIQLLGTVLIVLSLVVAGLFILVLGDTRWQVLALCGCGLIAGFVLALRPTPTTPTPLRLTSDLTAEALALIESTVARSDIAARSSAHAARLANDASAKSTETQRRIADSQVNVEQAMLDLAGMRLQTDFLAVASAAEHDDRRAFDQLRRWADDPSHPLAPRAERAWHKIYEHHSLPFKRVNQNASWRPDVDPDELNLGELNREYDNTPFYGRPAVIEYIWKRDDLNKRHRIRFLANIIENDDSLGAVEYAGRYLSLEFDLQLNPLDVEQLLLWWQKNRHSIG